MFDFLEFKKRSDYLIAGVVALALYRIFKTKVSLNVQAKSQVGNMKARLNAPITAGVRSKDGGLEIVAGMSKTVDSPANQFVKLQTNDPNRLVSKPGAITMGV
ncbi:hypothetical protein AAH994_06100 [Weeksellaceae bacterium A-14]